MERRIPDRTTPIRVYCRSGGRGSLAAATLTEMGYTDVKQVTGGIVDWSKRGFPVMR